jgi:hypothetical protein
MSHAEPQDMTVETVSRRGTGSGACSQVNRLLVRPMPFADALREMGRPRGWGAIGNRRMRA